MDTTEIRHVYGNVMRVAIPLTMRVRTMSEGVETETEEDFYPNLSYPIEIRLMRDGGYQKSYTPDVSGNVVTFTDDGTLPLGLYQVAVLCKDQNANACRYMVRAIIRVVSATIDAGIRAGVEFDTIDYVLEGAVFFYAKGDKGDKGDKGNKGDKGDKGDSGSDGGIIWPELYVDTDLWLHVVEPEEQLSQRLDYDDGWLIIKD